MKKILLVGKINFIAQGLYDCLGNRYSVQICEPTTNAVERMNKIIKPNIIIVFMSGDVSETVLRFMRFDVGDTPVIIICGPDEAYVDKYKDTSMVFMFKPVSNDSLVQKIEELTDDSGERDGGNSVKSAVNRTSALDDVEIELPVNKGENDTYDGLFKPKTAGKKKILAIDDDAMILRTVKGMLQDEYDVLLSTSVDKGLGLAMSHDIDAILLDYEMPNIDGCTAFAMFKMNFKTQDIPVIFLTGVSDRNRITEVIKLKPAAYLLKPVETDKVKQALREVLG